MEQRAKVMGKKSAAAVYRAYINKMKKKTKEKNKTSEGDLGELYSNPICPRKPGESDEAYKLRCAPLIGPSVLMNIPSLG